MGRVFKGPGQGHTANGGPGLGTSYLSNTAGVLFLLCEMELTIAGSETFVTKNINMKGLWKTDRIILVRTGVCLVVVLSTGRRLRQKTQNPLISHV